MLTVPEAAARLGVKRQWVWRLINEGRLKGEMRGRDYFIAEAEIERFERERRGVGRPKTK